MRMRRIEQAYEAGVYTLEYLLQAKQTYKEKEKICKEKKRDNVSGTMDVTLDMSSFIQYIMAYPDGAFANAVLKSLLSKIVFFRPESTLKLYYWSDLQYNFLQLGGPDGELAASTRYLSQRYEMPYDEVKGILTDIGTEELAHVEMISAIVYQLTRNLTPEEIKRTGFDTYFVDHTTGIYPIAASGVPFRADYIGVKGDVFADLNEDLAADAATAKEQPAFAKG